MNLNDFKNILLEHYTEYPKMQIQDMVKLIYQNEFGGGHFISDEKESLQRLTAELTNVKEVVNEAHHTDLITEIGDGLCRIDIIKANSMGLDSSTINKIFVNTANDIKGSMKEFEAKLEILRDCCRDGLLPFTDKELDNYLDDYKAKGYPAVSHSETYRINYQPAYRIIKEEYTKYYRVFIGIDELMRSESDQLTVAIDGNSGSGKSSLASLLENVYDCNLFHMDDFFLTPELRTEERLNEAGGNVDYLRFYNEVIKGLETGTEFSYRKFDCQLLAFIPAGLVKSKKFNIVEGSYSMHPKLINHYDLKIFLELNEAEQRRRILARNGPEMYKRFISEWIPMEEKYFKELGVKGKCDMIISV